VPILFLLYIVVGSRFMVCLGLSKDRCASIEERTRYWDGELVVRAMLVLLVLYFLLVLLLVAL